MEVVTNHSVRFAGDAPSLKGDQQAGYVTLAEEPKANVNHTLSMRILAAPILITVGAFSWTSWDLGHSPHLHVATSLAVSVALAVLCLAAWVTSMRVMLDSQRAASRDGDVAEVKARLLHEREQFRAIIDNLPDYLYVKNTESRFLLNNLAHSSALGVSQPQDLLGKSDFDFFPREVAEPYRAEEEAIIKSGQSVLNRVRLRRDNAGNERWVSVSKVPWRDNQGRVLGIVGITRDVNDTKVAEQKLQQFAVQLERSNRELQDFAYVASHDLQEPLRKIVVFGDRLREKCDGSLTAEAGDYLERMQKAARRMQILISDLLTFSRVTTKAQPFKSVDLAAVAGEVATDLEGRIEQVKGRVEIGTLPVVDAEPLQMRQLLQNLIGNALKFHRPQEPPVVTVEAQIISGRRPRTGDLAPEENLCLLTVSDNGIGFDEKYLDRIFEVFQRLHSRSEYEGTGMGLAICRKIVHHHGGEITAKSQPGHGTTFVVTLPVVHSNHNSHE